MSSPPKSAAKANPPLGRIPAVRRLAPFLLTHLAAATLSTAFCFAGAVYTVGLPVEGNDYWTVAWPLMGVILLSNVIGAMSALILLDQFSSRRRPSRPDAPKAS